MYIERFVASGQQRVDVSVPGARSVPRCLCQRSDKNCHEHADNRVCIIHHVCVCGHVAPNRRRPVRFSSAVAVAPLQYIRCMEKAHSSVCSSAPLSRVGLGEL